MTVISNMIEMSVALVDFNADDKDVNIVLLSEMGCSFIEFLVSKLEVTAYRGPQDHPLCPQNQYWLPQGEQYEG